MTEVRTNRIKVLQVSPEIFFKLFITGTISAQVEGLPDGSQFRGFAHDWATNCINIFVEHESFDEVKQGSQCPIHDVRITNLKHLGISQG